ncbi:D-alanine--D-alanine ligase family protein [Flaviflexus equikiangi]|uniref:D-alanine--D-alanine ligase family protein n=1 Tax=Flaviflexus equikiangi TaxID=2758573 RepID=UPI0015F59AC5|nr:D-alanine--D-alanine ligase [Flaviflexus equikiangi]
MTTPRTVAILAGGLNHERDVSIHSGRRVAGALQEAGYHAKVLDVDSNLLQRLDAIEPDVVWPLIHGSTGEDGSLQDLLELIGLPYVGTNAHGSRLGFQKPVAGTMLSRAGIAVPRSTSLPQSLFREVGATAILDLVALRYGFPVVIKPAAGGSALGVSIVKEAKDLPGAMVDSFAYCDRVLIEQYIAGSEVAVSVLETEQGKPFALPPVEIVTNGLYDYDARYNAGRSEYFVPARLSDDLLAMCMDVAVTAHRELHFRHISRSDLMVDSHGVPWFIDANSAPGMTQTSLLPQAVARYAEEKDMAPSDLYSQIVEAALTF